MQCRFCQGRCIKKGFHENGKQRYRCKVCQHYQMLHYKNLAWLPDTDHHIATHVKEGCGIRSISRILSISPVTVIRRIIEIASRISSPKISEKHQCYQVDELRTYIGHKKRECWVIYALNKITGQILDVVVGRRNKSNLRMVINTLLDLNPKCIYTDGLNIYPKLIPKLLHRVSKHLTNKIERMNLTLRTHLKRLSRRTICFSRSVEMLDACVRIKVWG